VRGLVDGSNSTSLVPNRRWQERDFSNVGFRLQYKVYGKNPIYNRLQSKAVQLGKAGFAGIKGIILCDAGCHMLTRQGQRSSPPCQHP
jgi:hypothetical protein